MEFQYYLCDVFSDQRFGGNPLAVLTDARGLTDDQMQKIAKEFNFSESAFVFPARARQTRKVRIFTPTTEVPFAGHPNIGTAFVLASTGEFDTLDQSTRIVFEEKAGAVPITLTQNANDGIRCELQAPQTVRLGATAPVAVVAAALSLDPGELVVETHPPQVVSVGLPFLIAELPNRSVLGRARVNMDKLEELASQGLTPDIFVYSKSDDDFDIRARMFAPFDGVPEDPATGSASCALAGLLCLNSPSATGKCAWTISQGVEMGRPSVLYAGAEKKEGVVTATWVGGDCVLISKGVLYID